MNPTLIEGGGETAPLNSNNGASRYIPLEMAKQTFGSPSFIISILIASIIPAVKLGIGLYYNGECPIDQRIPTYMIVAGISGLVLVTLSIFLALTFLCFISDSVTLSLFASCGICLNVMATVIISIFAFIWFIIGCVWIFGVYNQVQYNKAGPNYCNPVLYKWAFGLLIVTIIWAVLQCCFSCCRACFSSRKT